MAENDVSENSSLQEFSPAEHDFAEAGGENQELLFTNYFSSKAAFRDNMMAPLDKMYQQDKEFVDYVSKYCHMMKIFASDLDKLRSKYEKPTSKGSKTYAISQAYGAFSNLLQEQSNLFTEFADAALTQCFGVQTRETLSHHGKELAKASDEVTKADRVWSESIVAVKAKRKACSSAMQDCDKVEEKRPDTQTFSKDLLKYKNNKERTAHFLDKSIAEYLKTCTDSNSARIKFEFALEEALGKCQGLASQRVTLVSENLKKYLELHGTMADKFVKSCENLENATAAIDPVKEEVAFVKTNTSKGKQVLEPELIIFDLPLMRSEDQKKDETKLYSIRQMRKEVCFRTMKTLRDRESIVVKNLDLVSTMLDKADASSHGMQEKFTDKKKSYLECVNLLNELDILQVSIQNVINDVYFLNKSNSPRGDVPIYLAQFLTSAADDNKHGQLSVIRPPLEYYQNLNRDVSEMQLPPSIQQELASPSSVEHRASSSPGNTMSRQNTSGSHSGSVSVSQGSTMPRGQSTGQHPGEVPEGGDRSESLGAAAAGAPPDPDDFGDEFADSWQAVVKFAFSPSELYPGDDISYMLPISAGERVTVIESLENDWCFAENQKGERGHVPVSYLEHA